MDNEFIKNFKEKFANYDKKRLVIIAIGFVGILLIMISEIPSNTNTSKDKCESISDGNYVAYLEDKTSEVIGLISGVGRCKVMLTVTQSNENIYAKNVDENNQQGYYSQNNEYVLYKDDTGETPILIKENYPKISGVAVVCEGADKIEVKKQIIDTITSLFNISSSHISISKIKQ